MEERYYIKKHEDIFTSGAYIRWTPDGYTLVSVEGGDEYFRGNPVLYDIDNNHKPYIIIEEK